MLALAEELQNISTACKRASMSRRCADDAVHAIEEPFGSTSKSVLEARRHNP